MVTCEEFESKKFNTHGIHYEIEIASSKTTGKEIDERKQKRILLSRLVSNRFNLFYSNGNYKFIADAYEALEPICFIPPSTMKKVIIGAHYISREFLYKFTVGLKMDVEEANKYFALCGGVLTGENDCDFIVLNALRDKDSAESLVTEFWELLKKRI